MGTEAARGFPARARRGLARSRLDASGRRCALTLLGDDLAATRGRLRARRGRSAASTTPAPSPTGPSTVATRVASSTRPSRQIDAGNVARLKPAWIYHHGDFADGKGEYGEDLVPSHADRGRRPPLLLHGLQSRDRARRRDRKRALDLRPRDQDEERRRALPAHLSRGRALEGRAGGDRRRLRRAHLHGHARFRAHRARCT